MVHRINYEKLDNIDVNHEPYDYFVVENLVLEDQFEGLINSYPSVPGPGSYPLSDLSINEDFQNFIDEMNGDRFRKTIEEKFNISLLGKPTMFTVRGQCRKTDGKIHTDSKTKIITILLYMNQQWDDDGGRLRILHDGENINNYAEEVPPYGGTLLAFKRSDNSWHGHEPFEGQRRAIQMNWVTSDEVVRREQKRHKWSAFWKKINPLKK